jgi:predicted dehydrogenase
LQNTSSDGTENPAWIVDTPKGFQKMQVIAIIGTGFVADLYMSSLVTFPGITLRAATDKNPDRLAAFAQHWGAETVPDIPSLLAKCSPDDLILNLTDPRNHYAVSREVLEAGHHVYSEKPLAMTVEDARALTTLAQDKGLHLSSAPCSHLSEAAQTLRLAVHAGSIGEPLLSYAELDDGFISQAPYENWISASGAPWPAEDEFEVGCTLEHAGYYLTWLMMIFGPIRRVVAEGVELDHHKPAGGAPDYTTAILTFESGFVCRLTCSIIARHDHGLRIFGTTGTLEVEEAWNNTASVRRRARRRVRRRLVEWPFTQRVRLSGPSHPKVDRKQAVMNFMLGPAEVLAAIHEGRPSRMPPEFALHLTEVTLAIQSGGFGAGAVEIESRFAPLEPMPWAMALS